MKNSLKLALGASLSVTLMLAACGSDDASSGDGGGSEEGGGSEDSAGLDGVAITVGSKDFDEQLILGNIAIAALEDAGADVTDQINTGGTDVTRAALTGGNIDMYWEYNGTAWISFFGETDPIPDRIEQYEAVRDRDLEENDLVWLTPANFNNTYGIAFPTEAAGDLGNPTKISDLGTLIADSPDDATLCVENEFSARDDGLPGMEEAYGFEFPQDNIAILDTALVYTQADQRDPCNFGEVFTTDGRISGLDLTVLEDDESFFPLYNPSPVFRSEVYDENGDALDAIFDPIAEALTDEEMTKLNEAVSVNLELPDQVATDWLTEQGLIGG
ncbi:MAG: glycine betaine ABC transporter substrate-binding protein [Ornithinimicrobium sp.]